MPQQPNFHPVKFDLQTRFGSIYGEEETRAIWEVMARDAPTGDKKVEEFEAKFADYCGTMYAISVSNNTAAFMIAFKAIDIQPGDEVIVSPISSIAQTAAATAFGATIRFADVNPITLSIDPARIESVITPKTKAICPVHLYGLPAEMTPIMELAQSRGLRVIEDVTQAPGAMYGGARTGSMGDMGCFSFHEENNMSTLGEGGMITTNSPELYERARLFKSQCARAIGKSTRYMPLASDVTNVALKKGEFWYEDYDDLGYNFSMNEVTAAVGTCQLRKLDGLNARRREIATQLTNELANVTGILLPQDSEQRKHVYHMYPIQLEPKKFMASRDIFIYGLRADYAIKCGVHYRPLVQATAFRRRGYTDADCPVACERWLQLVTLPIHPRLMDEAVDYLVESIKKELLS